ncbi:MAG: DUF4270 domain-containing protein [Bacteroidaceae bacterium]|nr:DUF4270 domain-containing protein [Bacteroidaceae bacterium]
MRISTLLFSILLLLSFTFSSCRDEASTAGEGWMDSNYRNVVTDTCTISFNTILSDSLATSGDTICQIGHHKDNIYGDITSSFNVEYKVPSYSFNDISKYRYDSLTIRMETSGNYFGDTLSTQRISLYKLKANISFDESNYLYNCSYTPHNSTPLATIEYKPYIYNRKKIVEMKLPDTWGKEWFNLLLNDDKNVETQEGFRNYFKGIAFVPESNGNCINGIQVNDSSMIIRIYYHQIDVTEKGRTFDFKPSTTYNYSNVTYDRTGTPLEKMKNGTDNPYSSFNSNHQTYLQGMLGTYTSISFPYLNDLNGYGDLVSIESAVLKLYPVKGTYDDKEYPLPKKLSLYTANENNLAGSVVTNYSGSSVQNGNLVTDKVLNEDTYYSFDLTSFLTTNLGAIGYHKEKLQILLPTASFYSTVQGVVFDDGYNTANSYKKNTKLTVLFKIYTNSLK